MAGEEAACRGDRIDAMAHVRGMAERGVPRHWADGSRWQYRRGELEGSREEAGVIEIDMRRSLLAVHPWCDEAIARAEKVDADGFTIAWARGQSTSAVDLLTLSAECAAPGARS